MVFNEKNLNRLTSASLDLDNCLRFLKEIEHQEYGSIIYESLLISAIIFYVRPFSTNEFKDSKSPSNPRISDDVLKTLDKNEITFDKMLKKLRNKAIAHAEYSLHPTGFTDAKIIKAHPFSIWQYFKNQNDINTFINVAKKVLTEVHLAKVNEINQIT